MKNLIKNLKQKQNNKQGFTLVELLVVIAILAVLASVSVIGYLGFTTKARNSNAVTELAQVREVLRGELIDGKDHSFGTETPLKMKYVNNEYYFLDLSTAPDTTTAIDETENFEKIDDLASLFNDNKIYVVFDTTAASVGGDTTTTNDYKVTGMLYVKSDGGTANWVISTDTVSSGNGSYSVSTAS